MSFTVVFTGDIFIQHDAPTIDPAVINLFEKANICIANLEAPIVTDATTLPSPKAGPQLQQSNAIIPLLQHLRIQAVSGANNHLMDYGQPGLEQTQAALAAVDIQLAGAGLTTTQAKQPIQLQDNWIILCVCEEEFGIASASKPGSWSMYGNDVIEAINQYKKAGKQIIMYAHGGAEKIPVPTEYIVKRYREFIDAGAALVIGHHPHVVQGMEIYNGSEIYYSLGNFVHDVYPYSIGAVLQVTCDTQQVTTKLYPVVLQEAALTLEPQALPHFSALNQALQNNQLPALQQAAAAYTYEHIYQHYFKQVEPKEQNWRGKLITALTTTAKTRAEQAAKDAEANALLLEHLERNKSHAELITVAKQLQRNSVSDYRTPASNTVFQELLHNVLTTVQN